MRSLLLITLILFGVSSVAQTITWSAPVSVAPSSNGNMHPRIALDGSKDPVIVWGSSSMGGQAMFSRWNGSSFTTPTALNPMALPVSVFSWAGPNIASHGDTLYAVMKNQPEDTGRMYIVRSFDGGQNWAAPVAISAITDTSRFPTVTTDVTGNPTVGYMQFDQGFGGARYVVSNSNNFGTSFNTSVMASNSSGDVCDCCPASVVRSGNTVVMLYRNNLANIRTIWARISTDGGNTFPDSVEVDNTNWMVMSCPSSGPDGVVIGDTLYSVFRSSVSGSRFYLSKTSISTPQLISAGQFAANFTGLTLQDYPRIANTGSSVALVWKQVVGTSSKLCFSFTSNVTTGFTTVYDTLASSGVTNGDVAITPGAVHVVWEDVASGTVKYRKGTYTPVSVEEIANSGTNIQVYPNPANAYFTVSTKDITSVTECILVDNSGKRIALTTTQIAGKLSFSISGIAQGLYAVIIKDKEGHTYSSKLMIK
jgi:hypothetical protein